MENQLQNTAQQAEEERQKTLDGLQQLFDNIVEPASLVVIIILLFLVIIIIAANAQIARPEQLSPSRRRLACQPLGGDLVLRVREKLVERVDSLDKVAEVTGFLVAVCVATAVAGAAGGDRHVRGWLGMALMHIAQFEQNWVHALDGPVQAVDIVAVLKRRAGAERVGEGEEGVRVDREEDGGQLHLGGCLFFPCSSGEGLALQTVHYTGEGWAIYVAFLSIRDDGLVGDLHKNLDMACLSFFWI